MSISCGITGLPNVGKSTLFNAMTKAGIAAKNFPFCTIEPNVGVVTVQDARLTQVADLVDPKQIIPATVEFVDIAGLVAGASKGEGLGNQFLARIREVDALAHVVRCFVDDRVVHVDGRIDPAADIDVINTELALADLETLEKVISKVKRRANAGDKEAVVDQALAVRIQNELGKGLMVRNMVLAKEEKVTIKSWHLLTAKPVMYIANIAEEGAENNPLLDAVQAVADQEKSVVVAVCNKIEAEIAELDHEGRKEFLVELGLEEPGLNRVIRAGHELLGLHAFFTAGPQEVRAWTIPVGATAPQAAGVIHADFEKGFIRAEVVSCDDFLTAGGEAAVKASGQWRLEGKEYVIQDGDICHFRFNV